MRKPNETDMVILLGWLDRQIKLAPNTVISITSGIYGPLCGYVPESITGVERYVLSDKWFDPYAKN